tara:strand:- start:69 stop:1142 length:1074 start_codon:yes stop_codon:yes gene_type:complete
MAHLISSRNLFIDTSSDLHGGRGDDVTLQLGSDSIHANSGQQLRLTLTYFSMYKNYYNININNSKFRLVTEDLSNELEIPNKNYALYSDIVAEFAETVKVQALANALAKGAAVGTTATIAYLTSDLTPIADPLPVGFPNATSDRIMRFKISFTNPHTLTIFRIQCFDSVGDTYEILGGDRLTDPASTDSSFLCNVSSTTELTVIGLYPMQRSTDSHITLRCSLPNTNIETSSFAGGNLNSHTMSSNILAMIPVDFEFTQFNSSTDNEFFLNLTTQNLSSLRLFLRDHKNRPLGRLLGSSSQTAAGSGTSQSTLGNLNFRAIIRIDVIQQMIPRTLHSKPEPQTIPGRFLNGVLNNIE